MKTVKLSQIADIIAGQSPKSKFYTTNCNDTPFLQGNRTFGDIYPTIDTYTSKTTKIATKGSILMSVRAPVGDLNIATTDICIGRGLVSINAKNGNNTALFYILKQNIPNIIKNGNGTTYDSITTDTLKDAKIILPENPEGVANILHSIDMQIKRNKEMCHKLQVLIHTKYSTTFGNKNTHNGCIKDICLLPSGFSFKPEMYCNNGEYKLITIKNVNDIFVNTEKTDKLSTIPNNMKKYCNLSIGDILMSLTGNVGRISIVTEKNNLLNQRVSVLKCDEKYKTYIYALLNSQKYQITMQKISRGTSQKNLSPIDVENLEIFIPNNIEEFYDETILYFNQMVSIQQNTHNLLNLKNNILPLLVNGQVNI